MDQNVREARERQFLSEIEPGIRECLRNNGHDDRAVDDIVAMVMRRCRGVPVDLELNFPGEINSDARVEIGKQVSNMMHEVAGFFISALIDSEVERAYSTGAEPKGRIILQ